MTALTDVQALNLIRTLDEIDGQIEVLQSSKADLLADARHGMSGETKAEIAKHIDAVKKAAKKLRKARMKPEAADADEARDELADHYVSLASRDTRVHTHEGSVSWDAARRAGAQASLNRAHEVRPLAGQATNMRDHVVGPTPAHGSATPALGNGGTADCSSPAPSSETVTKSGVTAGESTGAYSDRAA